MDLLIISLLIGFFLLGETVAKHPEVFFHNKLFFLWILGFTMHTIDALIRKPDTVFSIDVNNNVLVFLVTLAIGFVVFYGVYKVGKELGLD